MISFIVKMNDESVRLSMHAAGDRGVRTVTVTHKLTTKSRCILLVCTCNNVENCISRELINRSSTDFTAIPCIILIEYL